MVDFRAESPVQLVSAHTPRTLPPKNGHPAGWIHFPTNKSRPLRDQSPGTRGPEGPPTHRPTVHRPQEGGPPNLPLATGGRES